MAAQTSPELRSPRRSALRAQRVAITVWRDRWKQPKGEKSRLRESTTANPRKIASSYATPAHAALSGPDLALSAGKSRPRGTASAPLARSTRGRPMTLASDEGKARLGSERRREPVAAGSQRETAAR